MAGQDQTILVVDDDPDFQQLMGFVLSEFEGLKVQPCLSGETALDLAKRVRPDLVILDLALPDIDGWEVLRALRSRPETATTPVVIVSAAITQLRKCMGVIAKLDNVVAIEKPFDLVKFTNCLTRFLRPQDAA